MDQGAGEYLLGEIFRVLVRGRARPHVPAHAISVATIEPGERARVCLGGQHQREVVVHGRMHAVTMYDPGSLHDSPAAFPLAPLRLGPVHRAATGIYQYTRVLQMRHPEPEPGGLAVSAHS